MSDEGEPAVTGPGTDAVHVEVEHDTVSVTALDVVVAAAGWALRARRTEDGWQVEGADGVAARCATFAEVFDRLPEQVEQHPVRAQVGEKVDRQGAIRMAGRSLLRRELTRGLRDLETQYGEREVAAWLAEEAGKRGLRLAADPDMDPEVYGVAAEEASAEPSDNLV
jgi:hypothetical protein